jgi:hypothetical protein
MDYTLSIAGLFFHYMRRPQRCRIFCVSCGNAWVAELAKTSSFDDVAAWLNWEIFPGSIDTSHNSQLHSSLFALISLSTRGGSHAREPPFSCAGNGSRDNYRCDIINYQAVCTARTQVSDCRMYYLAALYALKMLPLCRWQSVRRFIALNLRFLRMTALGWKMDNRFR